MTYKYYEINPGNYKGGNLNELNSHLTNPKDKVFILFYMEGCGPCGMTRPEWVKLKDVLDQNYLNDNSIVIAAVDSNLMGELKNIKSEPYSFPTMRYITNLGNTVEDYEDSSILTKDRKIDSFVEWIKTTIENENKGKGKNNKNKNKKSKKGGSKSIKRKKKQSKKRKNKRTKKRV